MCGRTATSFLDALLSLARHPEARAQAASVNCHYKLGFVSLHFIVAYDYCSSRQLQALVGELGLMIHLS